MKISVYQWKYCEEKLDEMAKKGETPFRPTLSELEKVFRENTLDEYFYFQKVAEIETDLPLDEALEHTFTVTNTIYSPWFHNPNIRVMVRVPRSTSVGDMLRVSGIAHRDQVYMVVPVGFEQVI